MAKPSPCAQHLGHLWSEYGCDVGQNLGHRAAEGPRVTVTEGFAVGIVVEEPLLRPPVEGGDPLGVQHQRQGGAE